MAMGPMSSALPASIIQAFQQAQTYGDHVPAQGFASLAKSNASKTSKTDGLPVHESVSTCKRALHQAEGTRKWKWAREQLDSDFDSDAECFEGAIDYEDHELNLKSSEAAPDQVGPSFLPHQPVQSTGPPDAVSASLINVTGVTFFSTKGIHHPRSSE